MTAVELSFPASAPVGHHSERAAAWCSCIRDRLAEVAAAGGRCGRALCLTAREIGGRRQDEPVDRAEISRIPLAVTMGAVTPVAVLLWEVLHPVWLSWVASLGAIALGCVLASGWIRRRVRAQSVVPSHHGFW